MLALSGCMMESGSRSRTRALPARVAQSDISLQRPWTGWDDAREPLRPLRSILDWTVLDAAGKPVPWRLTKRPTPKENNAVEIPLIAGTEPLRVSFRPNLPLPITEPFDTVELWVEWKPLDEPRTNTFCPVQGELWIEDAEKKILRIPWIVPDAPDWHVLNQTLAPEVVKSFRFPARLLAVEAEIGPGARGNLYLAGCTLYLRNRTPLDNRAPAFREKNWRAEAWQDERFSFPFFFREIESARLHFPVTRDGGPRFERTGMLLKVVIGSGPHQTELALDARQPLAGLQIRFPDGTTLPWSGPVMTGPDAEYPGSLLTLQRTTNGYLLGYSGGLVLSLEAEGSGLALEYSDSNRQIRQVDWPSLPATPIRIPGEEAFLSIVQAPGSPADESIRMVGLVWDSFASRASTGPKALPLPETHFVQVRYLPSEDGRLPILRERFLLSVSTTLQDLLPVSDSFRAPWLRPEQVVLVSGLKTKVSEEIARLGLSQVVILRPLPETGDRLSFDQRPTDSGWSRDAVLRRQDSGWAPGEAPGTTRMKPATRFFAWHEEAAALATPASGGACLLLLPERALQEWTDFDPRLAFAGSFRGGMDSSLAAWQEADEAAPPASPLLLEEDAGAELGPWAGALLLSDRQGLALAADPAGESPLRRFHQQPERLGVGSFGAWRDAFPDQTEETVLHRYLAFQIAHGVIGRIPEPDRITPASLAHAAHVLQSLRARLAGQPMTWIGYEHKGRLQDATAAWARGTPGDRVYLHYAHGVEIWINLSRNLDWEVTVGADRWRIPPDGWVATGPDYLNVSVLAEGKRIDYIESEGFSFFRGAGSAGFRGFSAGGPVLVRRGAAGKEPLTVEVMDYAQTGRVQIPGEEWTGFLAPSWEGFSEAGESLGPVEVVSDGKALTLCGPPGTLRYRQLPEIESQEKGNQK